MSELELNVRAHRQPFLSSAVRPLRRPVLSTGLLLWEDGRPVNQNAVFAPDLFALSMLMRFAQADSRPSAVLIDEHNTRAF